MAYASRRKYDRTRDAKRLRLADVEDVAGIAPEEVHARALGQRRELRLEALCAVGSGFDGHLTTKSSHPINGSKNASLASIPERRRGHVRDPEDARGKPPVRRLVHPGRPAHAARPPRGDPDLHGRPHPPRQGAGARDRRRARDQERRRTRVGRRDPLAHHLVAPARDDRVRGHPPHRLRDADVHERSPAREAPAGDGRGRIGHRLPAVPGPRAERARRRRPHPSDAVHRSLDPGVGLHLRRPHRARSSRSSPLSPRARPPRTG